MIFEWVLSYKVLKVVSNYEMFKADFLSWQKPLAS